MSDKLTCPDCSSENTSRVIAAGMPLKICMDCNTLWGEPFATIFTALIAPLEMWFNGYSAFMTYPEPGVKGYFHALWFWLKGESEDDND
jgi:hypothetical protein